MTDLEQLQKRFDGKLYYYAGFSVPERIDDVGSLTIESNYLGDVADEFIEELQAYKYESDEEITREQPFAYPYNIYFLPYKFQLQEFNQRVGIGEDEHLNDWQDRILV